MIRSRFAPSPTGYVHIGSLRTALFSHLLARHSHGVSILRIEDTDQNRLVQGALENLVKTLSDMGIDFDEGFVYEKATGNVKEVGDFGPYLQSNRLDIYQKHVQELLDKQEAYYCYCSSERLEEVRKEQVALKKPPMYDQKCRNLTAEEREAELKKCLEDGRKPVVRMKIPDSGFTIVDDMIYGQIKYEHKVLDDQIILKQDGFPTYHLAVVVDDHLMQITHVIRGEEWLPSTPKHILLYKAFGWEPTSFAHLPLILNADKSKLSKRQGDVAVEDYLKNGFLKEALVNFVALLGWNPKTEQELFSMDDLIREFDLSKVNKSGAVFDKTKLEWMNGKYIRSTDDETLAQKLLPYWQDKGWITENNGKYHLPLLNREIEKQYLLDITSVEKERLKKLSDITEQTQFYFSKPSYQKELLAWRKSTLEDAVEKLTKIKSLVESLDEATLLNRDKLQETFNDLIKDNGGDTGSVLWPLRVALTGLEKSSGPFEVMACLAKNLGKEEILSRLDV